MEARAVGETGVDERRRPIEPQAERPDDAGDEAADRVGVEIEVHGLDAPVALDVGTARAR